MSLVFSCEEAEQQRHISLPGLAAAGALLLVLLVPLVLRFCVSSLFTAVLYALAMCPCLASCVEVCRNPFDNPFKEGIGDFNRMAILHIVATALFPLAGSLPGAAGTVLVLLCGLGWTVSTLAGMPLLKKGLAPWEI